MVHKKSFGSFIKLASCSLLFLLVIQCLGKTRLYIGYTPSHKVLVKDWFLPSLTDENVELVEAVWEQTCESARFHDGGWARTVVRKFDLLLRGVEENWGGVFIYSDVDIQFFGDFVDRALECLGDKDVMFQKDNVKGTACSGFIVCRGNEKTKKLWETARNELINEHFKGDQPAINVVLKRFPVVADLQYGFLPWEEFFGPGMLYRTRFFEDGLPLYVPKTIRMHHANYVVGIPAKIRQLDYVNQLVVSGSFSVEKPNIL